MTLYSKNNQYPKPLPHRILLSNGNTRTDNKSFTIEEIADAGYTPVPDKPNADPWQTVVWKNSEWVIEDQNIQELKQQKNADINAYRDMKIYSQKTVNLSTGQTIPVDVRKDKPDLQNLSALVQKATLKIMRNESDTINFKAADNQIYTLTPQEAVEMGESVFVAIEAEYAQSWIKKSELEIINTVEEVYEFIAEWSNDG